MEATHSASIKVLDCYSSTCIHLDTKVLIGLVPGATASPPVADITVVLSCDTAVPCSLAIVFTVVLDLLAAYTLVELEKAGSMCLVCLQLLHRSGGVRVSLLAAGYECLVFAITYTAVHCHS